MKKIIHIISLLLMIAFLSCENPVSVNANLNEEFKLRIGEHAEIQNEFLRITFVAVTEDSRCPLGVECFWAGNAKVAITIQKDKNLVLNDSLNTYLKPREIEYLNYQIFIKNLEPDRVVDQTIPQSEYVATFLIKNNYNK